MGTHIKSNNKQGRVSKKDPCAECARVLSVPLTCRACLATERRKRERLEGLICSRHDGKGTGEFGRWRHRLHYEARRIAAARIKAGGGK